jgi:hypothetical protein
MKFVGVNVKNFIFPLMMLTGKTAWDVLKALVLMNATVPGMTILAGMDAWHVGIQKTALLRVIGEKMKNGHLKLKLFNAGKNPTLVLLLVMD